MVRLPAPPPALAHALSRSISRGGRRIAPQPLPHQVRPRVTVVVPCYNYGHYLAGCTRSILEQPGVDVDVIIVDDASPDGSGDVAAALADDDPRIRLIRHTTNQGHIRTYNDGLVEAKGDYVALLSADDLLAPGALQRAAALMEAEPSVGLVYGHPAVFTDDDTPTDVPGEVRDWTVWTGADWIAAQSARGMSCIYSPEAVLRNTVQQQIGGYDAALPHSADLDMWLRAAAVASVGRINGPVQALRREHPASMMHTTFAAALDDLTERKRAYDTFFDTAPAEVAIREARRAAHRRLAREAVELACAALIDHRPQDAAGYGAFAEAADSSIRGSWQWREFEARQRNSTGARSAGRRRYRLAMKVGAARRDLEGRVRWWRWYWSGV